MSETNGTMPNVELRFDRPRRWQMDAVAFERACDGFEEVGLVEYAEDPLASLKELGAKSDGKGGKEANIKVGRRFSKIMRVWVWAGLTGEDPELSLADFSRRHLTVGSLPKLAEKVLPVLTESIAGPLAEAPEGSGGATVPGPESASG